MGKQHNSFKKDMDLLGEAYGAMLGGAHSIQGTGIAAQQAAGHLAAEDGGFIEIPWQATATGSGKLMYLKLT